MTSIDDVLRRIASGLEAAKEVLKDYEPGDVAYRFKKGDDPITAADNAVDSVLKSVLPGPG